MQGDTSLYPGPGREGPTSSRGGETYIACTYVLVVGNTSWSGDGKDPKSLG
jgi:hypothetical protein